ncbi:MAG: hypothetical protein KDC70_04290 [Saprospiraceae bacterium]|nr:hypothetical protein [Saprospiraceae bacterium]
MKAYSDIDKLLDRYWDGETTLEEERMLKEYFASTDVEERHLAAAALFRALREEQSLRSNATAKKVALRPAPYMWAGRVAAAAAVMLLSAGIWWWMQSWPESGTVSQEMVAQKAEQKIMKEPRVPSVSKEAPLPQVAQANVQPHHEVKKSGNTRLHHRPAPDDTPDPEAEKAMEEIKAALALVSSKIKKGRDEAAKGAIHLESIEKISKIRTDTDG